MTKAYQGTEIQGPVRRTKPQFKEKVLVFGSKVQGNPISDLLISPKLQPIFDSPCDKNTLATTPRVDMV